jgi:hypothetical protein
MVIFVYSAPVSFQCISGYSIQQHKDRKRNEHRQDFVIQMSRDTATMFGTF